MPRGENQDKLIDIRIGGDSNINVREAYDLKKTSILPVRERVSWQNFDQFLFDV